MGLYHSVSLAWGFELTDETNFDHLDKLLGDESNLLQDSVGRIVIVGDYDRLLLVTRNRRIEENAVVRLTADNHAEPDELAASTSTLHDVAVRLGYPDHPEPAWLVIHNHR